MEYWTAFILGLAGSLHCAGMCGPLALALPSNARSRSGFIMGRLAYNTGRMGAYAVLGLVFGLFGQSLSMAGLQRWVSIGLGLLLLVGLFSSKKLASWVPIVALVSRLKAGMSSLLSRRSLSSLALLGLLNGFLPCGLVYVACAGAASTGNIASGAIYMAIFGLGTIPMILAIGLSGSLMPFSLRLKLRKTVPAAVFVLALLLLLRGMALDIPYLSPNLESQSSCCHHPITAK